VPPWPGRMPWPPPSTVLPVPVPVTVYDATGGPVGVSARLEVSAAPARIAIGANRMVEVTCWNGPWPVEERWWAEGEASRRARFQMGLSDGRWVLLTLAGGVWAVEAVYD
jgi:protein ImuB